MGPEFKFATLNHLSQFSGASETFWFTKIN
jgi:hypothetical protein